jgi:glycosyltransferase involved in cell wall biosynthesis
MEEHPLVSVIIPTYNRANTISRAIISAIKQTESNIEILIVDDCSNDNTKFIVEEWAIKDPRIHYIGLDKNVGPSAARNYGIQKAKGDYFAFLDSDDEWVSTKIKVQVASLERDIDKDVTICDILRIDDGNLAINSLNQQNESPLYEQVLARKVNSNAITLMIRKRCYDLIGGFDEKLRINEDWEYWLRLSKEFNFAYVNEPLAINYSSNIGLSNNPRGYVESIEYVINKHNFEYNKFKNIASKLYYDLGCYSILNLDRKIARSQFMKSIRYDMSFIRAYFGLILSFFNNKLFKFFVNLKF